MRILILLIVLNLIIGLSFAEYFTIRQDLRRCAAPYCGGKFLKKVNAPEGSDDAKEIYVNSFSMINANLNFSKVDDEKNVIVYGKVQNDNKDDPIPSFFVQGIHQRMALDDSSNIGGGGDPNESYYFLSNSGILCKQAKGCPIYTAKQVNYNDKATNFATYTEGYSSSIVYLDKKWFDSRLINNNSGYVGSIVKGSISKDGNLSISSVFANTDDPVYPCKKETVNCRNNKIGSYSRSLDRCPVFQGCVNRSPCHLGIPHCPNGYVLVSLNGPKGCPIHYCDSNVLPNPLTVMGP